MSLFHKLLACHHPRTTWPRGRFETSGEYLRCLDCGEALPYDTRRMCVREDVRSRFLVQRLAMGRE